ncbi:hypothetical protein O181_061831 [Austropuccinia psidii MF-1]|uniref:Uncharacterized protein n=1 Tax=Austropuccinia psidii MF-1 TaxID=1389203 RepID=A0A9Q3HXY4_9BASI|nr:hypothetical protein [Austropuccinia psidii MF-1]
MEITKDWNPTRQSSLLQERATRIRENQATIQGIEERLNQTGPTLIPSQSQGTRIQVQKQDIFKPKADRVRPNDPDAVGLGVRSTQKPEKVLNTCIISIPTNRNIIPTQTEHNVVTPDSNLNSDKLWIQIFQFAVQTQEQLDDIKRLNGILQRNEI